MGGKGESATEVSGQPSDSLYPSIRKLPLLGVTYADLYRQAKIQEVVLETLTKEYEMAKVQEAKEIPTVKVLDAANILRKEIVSTENADRFYLHIVCFRRSVLGIC